MSVELIDLGYDVTDPVLRRVLCQAYFEQVYKPAFPRPDETESPEIWLSLIDNQPTPPRPTLHLIIARENGHATKDAGAQVAGGIVVEYFQRSRSALVTYLAVKLEQRGQGLAHRLLKDAIARVTVDNGGTRPEIYAEVERPELQKTDAERLQANQRTKIISALGGRRIGIDYIQPRLGPGKRPVEDLMLVLLASDLSAKGGLPTTAIRAFLEEFFGSLDQLGSPEYKRVLSSIPPDRAILGAMS